MSKDLELPHILPLVIVIFMYLVFVLVLSFYTWLVFWVYQLHVSKCECITNTGPKIYAFTLIALIIGVLICHLLNIFFRMHFSINFIIIFCYIGIIITSKLLMHSCECEKFRTQTIIIINSVLYFTSFLIFSVLALLVFWILSGRSRV